MARGADLAVVLPGVERRRRVLGQRQEAAARGREVLVDQRPADELADARAQERQRRGVVVEDARERGLVGEVEVADVRVVAGEVRRVAREQHPLGEVDGARVGQLVRQVGALRIEVRAEAEDGRDLDRLRGQRRHVHVRRRGAAGAARAAERQVAAAAGAAAERERGVEPDQPGALLVARVAPGRRVAVEVPAREGRRQRPAERVPAADHLAGAPRLARDPGAEDRVPVLHRPLEAELAQERGVLRADEPGEGLAVHRLAAPVVVPGDRSRRCARAAALIPVSSSRQLARRSSDQYSISRPRRAARRTVFRATWSKEPAPPRKPGMITITASARLASCGPSALRKRRYSIQSQAAGCSPTSGGSGS